MVSSLGVAEAPGTITPDAAIDLTYYNEGNYSPETTKDEFSSWEMTTEMVGYAVNVSEDPDATTSGDEPSIVLPDTTERNTVWVNTTSGGFNWTVYHATDFSTGIADRWGSYTVADTTRFTYDPELDTWWVD